MSRFLSGPVKLNTCGVRHSSGNPTLISMSHSCRLASKVILRVCMDRDFWSQKYISFCSPPLLHG